MNKYVADMVKETGQALTDKAYDHTMETGHVLFGLLKTKVIGDNKIEFYKECLECN